jgi:RNA ligase
LVIWNYTAKVQYEQLWDELTLQCRALVTDLEGNIISRGFSKFFNIEENRHEPTDDFEVFEKLDGQYIGCFWYNGEMVVNSKGSFTSPYAVEAKRILEDKYPRFVEYMNTSPANKDYSFIFELLGFEQIVIKYDDIDLILTGATRHCYYESLWNYWDDISVGYEGEQFINSLGLKIVQKFNGLDWKNIKQLNWQNSEGFVVRFSNGSRCKIKFEDYLKLHRQMTNLSTTGIWEALMNGEPVSSILNDVPDEFYDKVHQYENELNTEYADLEWDIKSRYSIEVKAMRNLEDFHGYTENQSRKVFAENTAKYPYKSILFAMLDGKDYSKIIWKLIKPKFEKI